MLLPPVVISSIGDAATVGIKELKLRTDIASSSNDSSTTSGEENNYNQKSKDN
ncbi:MAG TPA: hypothetical protein VFZ67_03705 [Nitrososphaera sp.]